VTDPASSRWRIYEALRAEIKRAGHSPTVRELAALVDLAVSTVHRYLKLLKREGWIDWPAGKARSISTRRLPAVQAFAQQHPLARLDAPPDGAQPKADHACGARKC